MKLPFEVVKKYQTLKSKEEIKSIIENLLTEKDKTLGLKFSNYKGKLESEKFQIHKVFNSRRGPAYPKIIGTLVDEHQIEIRIQPHYIRILFLMMFPMIFLPTIIFSGEMTINGILREPTNAERLLFSGFSLVLPLILGYIDTFSKYKSSELWIKDKLDLTEIK